MSYFRRRLWQSTYACLTCTFITCYCGLFAFQGVKGLIYDQEGKVVPSATLKIKGRDLVSFRSSKYGEYWRILLPGTYTLQVNDENIFPTYLAVNNNVIVFFLHWHSNCTYFRGNHILALRLLHCFLINSVIHHLCVTKWLS